MKTKPIIIAIVGESGSGKTSLSLFLQERVNVPAIVSYTTRPMREGEQDGVEHYFVDDNQAPQPKDAFAYTEFGGFRYWTNEKQFTQNRVVTYVVDEKGLLEMIEKWDDKYCILSVLVQRPENPTDEHRKNRDKGRVSISPESYDVVLVNDGTLQEFYREAIFQIGNLVSKNWHWE